MWSSGINGSRQAKSSQELLALGSNGRGRLRRMQVSWSATPAPRTQNERVTLRSLFVDGVVGITPNLVRTRQQKGEDSEGLASVYLRKQK